MKSKRTALLKKIFAGRDLEADAKALGINLVILNAMVGKGSTTIGAPIPAATAVAIGKLTGTSPRAILAAQTDDELLELGVASLESGVGEVKAEPAIPAKRQRKAKPAGSRSPFGGRSSFKLD